MSVLARNLCPICLLIALLVGLTGCGDPSGSAPQDPGINPPNNADQPKTPTAPPHLISPPRDPRAALSTALNQGLLDSEINTRQRLAEVLRVTGVPEASQVLVFSKTSLQSPLISFQNPRAIYFNDDCYIGYVPGGLIEFGDADADPEIGSGLFALDPREGPNARLYTDNTCLNCHEGSRTNDRRGFLVRSVFTDEAGHPITSAGTVLVGHETPINRRWGGWFVTGTSGSAHHRGNQTAVELDNGDAQLDPALGSNITDLSGYFNTDRYLVPTSDIVALMVLEHQVQMHNLLTQGSSAVYERVQAAEALAEHLGRPFDPEASEVLQTVLHSHAQRIVEHLLFCDETDLEDPVVGGEDFQNAFRANRREDAQGRSLKDFDLQTRMFRYRCSYMIYSRAFELMHPMLKQAVLKKLRGVLNGSDDDPAFDHLHTREREAILEILRQTTDHF